VEVEERLETCPLCDTRIPDEVREHPEAPADYPEDVIPPKPLYRKPTERQQRFLIVFLITFLGLFPIILTAGLDLVRNGGITWSYYVMIPLLGAAGIGWIIVHFGRRPVISVTAALLILLAVQLLIALRYKPGGIAGAPELPFFLASFAAVELLVIYLTRRHPPVLKLLSFIFLDVLILLLVFDWLISGALSWSLIAASCLLPVSIYLIYIRKVRKKGLNLAGFFFLDLTLMLSGIDYSTAGALGWSLVTSFIFVTLAALFYLFHIVFFNDTDWKKALHL